MLQDAPATQSSRQNAPLPFLQLPKDGEAFERFCTDLLNAHPTLWLDEAGSATQRRVLTAERLAGGSNQRGADIRATVEGGQVWMIQCKRVETFRPSDAKKAAKELEVGFPSADRYVLAITHPLSLKTREELSPKWEVWDADKLTSMARNLESKPAAIALIRKYFNDIEAHRILQWSLDLRQTAETYFSRTLEEDYPAHHRLPFIDMGGVLNQLLTFARHGSGHAQVLSGAAGQGKSRLLLEVARSMEAAPVEHQIQVEFIGQHTPSPSDHDLELLTHVSQPTLLVMEGSQHRLEALDLIAHAASRSAHIRLLVVARPDAKSAVVARLRDAGYSTRFGPEIILPRWTSTRIQKLAEAALGPRHQAHLPRLCALAQHSPLLVVLGAAVVRAGEFPEQVIHIPAFEHHVLRVFMEGFLSHQPEARRDELRNLVRILALVGPVPIDNLPKRLGALTDCRGLEIAQALDSLKSAGLTIEYAAKEQKWLRLYPDLFGEAVLREAVRSESGKPGYWLKELCRRLHLADFPAILRNLSIADWECAQSDKGQPGSLLEPVWSELKARFVGSGWEERKRLLQAWLPTAGYQPIRSLELTRLALTAPDAAVDPTNPVISLETFDELGPEPISESRARVWISAGQVLEPIVVWHPEQAREALDLLWVLAGKLPTSGSAAVDHPINLIARAATYATDKPLSASEAVLSWIEKESAGSRESVRRLQSDGTFSALLKPFFGRSIEQLWQTGNVIHSQRILVDPEKVGPLRQRALALIQNELLSGDDARVHTVLPCLTIAVERNHDIDDWRDESPSARDWEGQRLAALQSLSEVIPNLAGHPFALLDLVGLLRHMQLRDGNSKIANTSRALLDLIPDTLELRLARAISWDLYEEVAFDESAASPSERKLARRGLRLSYLTKVADECFQRWPTAQLFAAGLEAFAKRSQAVGRTPLLAELSQAVVELSAQMASELLPILLQSPTNALDDMLESLFSHVRECDPRGYGEAISAMAQNGPPSRLEAWIHSLRHGMESTSMLRPEEQRALEIATRRNEDSVVVALAQVAVHWSARDPQRAQGILRALSPASQNAAGQIYRTLIFKNPGGDLSLPSDWIESCLQTFTSTGFEWLSIDCYHSSTLLQSAPLSAYKNLSSQIDAGHGPDLPHLAHRSVSLGPIADRHFLNNEITRHWSVSEPDGVVRSARISLIRALINADSTGAPERRRALIQGAGTAEDLLRAVHVAFPDDSQAVLTWPELVALALRCSERFVNTAEVSGHLFRSICFGSRSATSGQVDAPYASIVDRANDLAHRHEGNLPLAELYGSIARAESTLQQKIRADYIEAAEHDE